MAELIVTDASHVDQASLEDFTLDAAWVSRFKFL